MAQKQELEFTIDDDGKISIKVVGIAGKECLELTKEIEAALGLVTDRKRTSEFYQEPDKTQAEIEGKQG
jgi:protein involved in polysaccharide export with SLBB domain